MANKFKAGMKKLTQLVVNLTCQRNEEYNLLHTLKRFQAKEARVRSENIAVLLRVICSIMEWGRLNGIDDAITRCLFREYPRGTIFTRTCSDRGAASCTVSLDKHTTFTNLSPLGNLMIGNASVVNNKVVFFKAKKRLKFLDLNFVAQLFGSQIKAGVPPGSVDEHGANNARGIFSACCNVQDMPRFCQDLGVVGVIQVDVADAYYFNEDPEYIPTPLKKNRNGKMSTIRKQANLYVIDAINNKCAYPFFSTEYIGQGYSGSGALFPEFNFHYTNYHGSPGLNDLLEYANPTDIRFFRSRLQSFFHKGAIRNSRTGFTQDYIYLVLDEVLTDITAAREYFNINHNKHSLNTWPYESFANARLFYLDEEFPWTYPTRNKNVLRINPNLECRQNMVQRSFKSLWQTGLPYLCNSITTLTNNVEKPIVDLIFSDAVLQSCGRISWRLRRSGHMALRPGIRRGHGTTTIYKTNKTPNNNDDNDGGEWVVTQSDKTYLRNNKQLNRYHNASSEQWAQRQQRLQREQQLRQQLLRRKKEKERLRQRPSTMFTQYNYGGSRKRKKKKTRKRKRKRKIKKLKTRRKK